MNDMKALQSLTILSFVFVISTAFAQHEHHQMDMNMDMDSSVAPMTHAYSLNLPMNRNGSGTGWLTDASPMYGYMVHSKKWMYMFHGNIALRYDDQNFNNNDKRGESRFDA